MSDPDSITALLIIAVIFLLWNYKDPHQYN